MISLKFAVGFVGLCMMVFICSLPCMAVPSGYIPLNSWIYPTLDKLSGLGLIDSSLQGSRPYSRLEAARQTAEGLATCSVQECPPVSRELLRRVSAQLKGELTELNEGTPSVSYFKPLRQLQLDFLFQDGLPSTFPNTNAQQFSLNYNNDGIDYTENSNGQLTWESEARLGRFLLIDVRPILEAQERSHNSLNLLYGSTALSLGPLELSAGRQSLWWGQGKHGSLLLTNNAKPLDLVRLTNPSPVLLPWFFRHLGPFRFDTFLSRLEEKRVVSEPYFGGLRINIKPLPWLEFGAARTVLFGGKGRADLDFENILTIIGGENISGEGDTSNSLAAIDVRIRLPFLAGIELYSELGGEDEGDLLGFIPFPAKKALLAGIYLPRIEPTGRLDLRFEYADLNYQSHGLVWYRHSVYRSGYTYEGKILGHHAGGDSVDIFSEIRACLLGNFTLSISYDHESRGETRPVQEKHFQPMAELKWVPSPNFGLSVRYAHDRVENLDFIPGRDHEFYFASVGLDGNW